MLRLHHAIQRFNTQPPEGGWPLKKFISRPFWTFQHTAARRRLVCVIVGFTASHCFNTQPPEGGWLGGAALSRSEACFNTQPPEGGWAGGGSLGRMGRSFNTQPPEGGWLHVVADPDRFAVVSTHSRPKAAGAAVAQFLGLLAVSTHSRPKAAGCNDCQHLQQYTVSTHSRPKAAGNA